ncbi:MAG: hypothetical protein R3Y32_00225 [Bacillota bacterium]
MKSHIGKTFNNKNTQYTILEQVVINDCDKYTVSLLIRNNVDFPCFVIAQGLNLTTGEWDSGTYPDNMEDAFFAMEAYRNISRKISKITAPSLQHFEMLCTSMTKPSSEAIVRELSKQYEKKQAIETLINKANLLGELYKDISFKDLSILCSFAHDVWLKSEEVALVDVTDFIAYLINEETATIDTIVSCCRHEFGCAVLNKDYNIEDIRKVNQ